MSKSAKRATRVVVAIVGVIGVAIGAIFLSAPSRPSDVPSATNRTWSEIGQELLSECDKYEFFLTNTPAGSADNIEAWLKAAQRISGGQRSEAFRKENPVVATFAELDISGGLGKLGQESLDSLIANGGGWNMSGLADYYPDTYKVLGYNTASKALEVCGLSDVSDNLSDLAVQSRLIVDRAANYTKPDSEDGSNTNLGGAETLAQENARRSAEEYLRFGSFSREGLIRQLEFEGYERSDATYGVDATSTDWNVQAALKAQEYLDYSAFSKEGLRDQLIFEGFTPGQAQYGLEAVGY